jgi:hypothetical protein
MTKKLVLLAISTIAIVVLAFGVSAFVRARSTSSLNACINNLRYLEGIKQQWAVGNGKSSNDFPTWEAIGPYLQHGVPICPQGGKYTLERIDNRPSCSLGGGDHTLP